MRGGRSADRDATTDARNRRGSRVGRRDGLTTGCLECDAEGADAVGQRGVGWQDGLGIAAGEVDGAGIASRLVVELIEPSR